eukprot:3626697-Prorocentrum_lima.AAC.1
MDRVLRVISGEYGFLFADGMANETNADGTAVGWRAWSESHSQRALRRRASIVHQRKAKRKVECRSATLHCELATALHES